jgi:hypothetical protein
MKSIGLLQFGYVPGTKLAQEGVGCFGFIATVMLCFCNGLLQFECQSVALQK